MPRSISTIVYKHEPGGFDDLDADHRAALAYWQALAPDGAMPTWQAFDLVDLPPPLLPSTHVVDIRPAADGHDFRFRFWGTRLADYLGAELTGKPLDAMHGSQAYVRTVKRELLETVEGGVPRVCHAVVSPVETLSRFQTTLRLPLGDEDGATRHCVSLVRFWADSETNRDIFARIA